MIDIENEVFDRLSTLLQNKYPGITVHGETVLAPGEFPCVCIEEADSYSYLKSADSSGSENHAGVMYEVNVYSNRAVGKKSECKKIFGTVDDFLIGLGFTRTSKTPITLDDATKYRMTGRYTAVVSKNNEIYGR